MITDIKKSELDQIIAYLGVSGKLGLPEVPMLSNEKYLEARSGWTASGIAELEFDGNVRFNQPYVRMFYNMVNARAGLVFTRDHHQTWCIRGPVDLLWIEADSEEADYHLYRSANSAFDDSTLEQWGKYESGKLSIFRNLDGAVKTVEMNADDLNSADNQLRVQQFFFVEA